MKLRSGILSLLVAGALLNLPAYAHHHQGPNPGQGGGQTGSPGNDQGGSQDSGQVPGPSIGGAIPPCMNGKQVLPIDNAQVLKWKTTTQNQYLNRGHVQGPITKIYPDHSGHTHFEIELGSGAQETLEIIYNQSFGALPALRIGMNVEACGDYITSIAQSGPYPASPDGAILHWVHRNPSGGGHDSGFVAVDGILYGQGNGNGNFQLQAIFPSFESPFLPEAE